MSERNTPEISSSDYGDSMDHVMFSLMVSSSDEFMYHIDRYHTGMLLA